jgi:O-6-methylguanine DNA methyltransferase
MISIAISTSAGAFTAHYTSRGLARLDFPNERQRSAAVAHDANAQVRAWASLTRDALEAVLGGSDPAKWPPLDVQSGTAFQQKVWEALRNIGRGRSKSYGEIARELGTPNAARAVGSACGANPIPLLIPCHRVLASGGKLGGFSGGLDWKKRLLSRELVAFSG